MIKWVHHMLPRSCLVVLCGFSIAGSLNAAQAQRVFRGAITDADTGEPLAYVTLQVKETGGGTITNAAGIFEVNIARLPATVIARHIGYETREMLLDDQSPARFDVQLVPAAYELEEVVVTGEDPAYNIMRKVIERKQRDRLRLSSYLADTYSRFALYSEFDLAQMQETIARHYWRPGEGTRSLIRARRKKPPHSGDFRFASTRNVPDFYDDSVELLGFTLVGPTSPEALDIYTFTLGGHWVKDGSKVYDIYFSPKSGFETALVGYVSVLDEEYVVLKIGARPSPNNVLPAPIKSWDAFYEQQFAPVGDSLWLPVDLQVEGSVSFGRIGAQYPTARYRQVSRLTGHVLNVPAPDSMFSSSSLIVRAPNVDRQDHLFRWNPGLIPMTPEEIEDVVTLDPGKGLNRSFRPQGMLAGYTAVALEDVEEEPADERPERMLGTLYSGFDLAFNRVEGIYLGLNRSMAPIRNVSVDARAGYGLGIDRPSYGAALEYRWGGLNAPSLWPHRGYVRLGFDQRFASQYASLTYSRFVNSATTYVGWPDYFDYYDRQKKFAEVGFRADRLRALVTAAFSREDHTSVEATRGDKGWLFGDRRRANSGIVDGRYDLMRIGLRIGEVPEVQMRAGGNGVYFSITRQADWGRSDVPSFTVYDMQGVVTLPTFHRRRAWPNTLAVRVHGRTYAGEAPRQFAGILDVSRRPIASFGAFKSLHGLPVKGRTLWSVYWEHDFSTSVFEYLNLWSLARRGVGITIHGAHGQALHNEGLRDGDPLSFFDDGVHHEVGFSMTHFFNVPIRIDVVKNLDQRRLVLGVGVTRRF